MGSTEIINRTSKALDMQVGNCRYFIKLTTVDKNESYTVHVDYNDTYMEYLLAADGAAGKALIVNSDECVDNKKIIIREVDGELKVEMEPRVKPSPACEPPKKRRRCPFWRLWIF